MKFLRSFMLYDYCIPPADVSGNGAIDSSSGSHTTEASENVGSTFPDASTFPGYLRILESAHSYWLSLLANNFVGFFF